MQPPITKKEIQYLTDRLAALNIFISRYSNHLQSFFKALKGADSKGWGPECDDVFLSINKYIISSLSLSQPVKGEELYLYLAALAMAVSVALVRLDPRNKQRLVYFISKVLIDVETKYTDFERMALALRVAAKKLQPYFQAHTIVVHTSSSIRAVLHKPDASGRLLKWAIELSDFDIEYHLRSAIKGKVLADFIVERSEVHP